MSAWSNINAEEDGCRRSHSQKASLWVGGDSESLKSCRRSGFWESQKLKSEIMRGRPRVPLHTPTLVYNPSNPSSCLMLSLSEINLSIPRPGVALETT